MSLAAPSGSAFDLAQGAFAAICDLWIDLRFPARCRTMNCNTLYLIIAALVVVAAVVGFQLYQERQKTERIEIKVDKGGISIEKK